MFSGRSKYIKINEYARKEYDPQFYINRILEAINDARKNGIRVDFDFDDNILEIENTIKKDEKTIDFNEEFKY